MRKTDKFQFADENALDFLVDLIPRVGVQILVEVLQKYLFRSLLTKNTENFVLGVFYPSRRLGISSRRSRGYHQPLWGCISSRASVYLSCGLM